MKRISADFDTPEMSNGSVGTRTSSVKSVYESDDDPLLCGFGRCTPRWLQWFHNAKWLLAMLGLCAFVQSLVVNAIFPVDLSTLEKRFHMTSTQTGIITSWYDFAVLLAVFPVCHWGNTGHKGRWIGLGTFIMGLGSLVCALPHYLVEPYKAEQSLNSTDFEQCMPRDGNATTCSYSTDQSSSYLNPYFLLFILGQTLHGVGATPLFSIGTAYIDENVSQKASPVYLAIHALVTTVGPVMGLFAGGSLLKFHEDFDRVDVSTIPVKYGDPHWVGAWWLGFLGCAVAAILNAFPILMFARELPEAKRHRMKDVNQCHAVSQVDENADILKGGFKTLPPAIWNILRNPTFVTTVVLGIFEAIIINGFSGFMPKILETILSTNPATAAYLASLVIIAAAAGVMLGGLVIRQLNLQVPGMLKMIIVCHVTACILITSFIIQCPSREYVGVTINYDQPKSRNGGPSLSAPCNAGCDCKSDWNPVCHLETGQVYLSACYAGCTSKREVPAGDIWSNCQCLPDDLAFANSSYSADFGTVEANQLVGGLCTPECGWKMYAFLTLLFFSVVASFAAGIPSQQIMLRVVPFQQRTLAIGLQWSLLRLLGFIPGGILFGLMIDTTCLKWQTSACGKKQSCLIYDSSRLSWTIMAVAVVCKLVAILATIVGYMTYRPTDLDSGLSIQTTDSRGPLSLTVNDDRPHMENGHVAHKKQRSNNAS
ncbi:Protein Y70G10A.3 [Aphelenchoides avenae]|nr:Protein Y70G10A.3 [Aphelenchus avenae]